MVWCSTLVSELAALSDFDWLFGSFVERFHAFHFAQDGRTTNDATKGDKATIQVAFRLECHKKLTLIRVRATICHAQNAARIVRDGKTLIGKGGSVGQCGLSVVSLAPVDNIAALDPATRDDPVNERTFVSVTAVFAESIKI